MELLTNHEQITDATCLGVFESGSAEWQKLREEQGIITGSTIGSIIGVNEWESAVTRYYKAIGAIPNEIPVSTAMALGTHFEQPILDFFAKSKPNWTFFRTGTWSSVFEDWARANPDALFLDENGELGLIEVKFSGRYWGGVVPANYRAQIMWYLGVLGLKRAVLVGLIDSRFETYEIEFDQFEFEVMLEAAKEFRKALKLQIPPDWDGAANTYETAKLLHPEIENREEEIAEQLGIDLQNTSSEIDALTIKLNELKSRTLDQMGSAKTAVIEVGSDRFVVATRSSRNGGTPYLTVKKGK
jgi:predicted phage-related endonuclease